MVKERLGEMLVKTGLITQEQLNLALEEQKKNGERIGYNLVHLNFLTEEQIITFLGKQWNLPSINLNNYDIMPEVIKLVPIDVVLRHQVIPIDKIGNMITLAMVDPSNIFAINDIKFMTGCEIEPVVCADVSLKKAIEKYYEADENLTQIMKDAEETSVEVIEEQEELDVSKLKEQIVEAPVVKLVNLIITDAVRKEASDIHVEPYEDKFRVRYRIDGVLYTVMSPPLRLRAALTSRLKIMAELDIAERRLPQDGRIKIKMRNKAIDIRLSTIPTIFGEKVVMRLLDKSSLTLDLTQLGFEQRDLKLFEKTISSPYGIVLITGPTGSGKTTTLYSALNKINSPDINIMTAEDPIEYNLMGINQVQTKPEIGLTFANCLRAFLRQDPDVIMLGEIRDFETAEIAMKAALTGHLVLSTLHTNDAASAINRLLDMNVEPFLVASSLIMSVAQRLLRKICPECREKIEIESEILNELGITQEMIEKENLHFYHGKGCSNCSNTGYRGRIAIYEILPITEPIRELILKRVPSTEIKRKAEELGMHSLKTSAILKLKEKITSVAEVLRVVSGGNIST